MRLTFQDQPVHSGWFARKTARKRQGPATPQRGYAEAKRIEAQGSRPAANGVAWSPSIVASMAETAASGGRRPPSRTAVLAPRYNGKTRRKRSLSTRRPRCWQSRPGAVGEVSSPGEESGEIASAVRPEGLERARAHAGDGWCAVRHGASPASDKRREYGDPPPGGAMFSGRRRTEEEARRGDGVAPPQK